MFVLPVSRSAHRSIAPQVTRAFDRLFDESFDRYAGGAGNTRTPALDVSESDTDYTVVFDVPGVTREQLAVSVEGRRVSIETVEAPADKDEAVETPKAPAQRALYRERSVARYARTVSLPAEVDQTKSSARFDNGVLTLTLAKKVPAGATRLSIS